jgi:hypothetical protein
MADSEHFPPNSTPDEPHIPPDIVSSYFSQPHDFEEMFKQLRETDRERANWVMIQAEKAAPGNIAAKRAFARDLLMHYGLEHFYQQVTELEETARLEPYTDGTHTATPIE